MRGLLIGVVVVVTCGGVASAQAPPPPGVPNDQARRAAVVLARECAALVALGGFGTQATRVAVAVEPVPARGDELVPADDEGAAALTSMTRRGVHTTPDVQAALGPLSAQDRAAATAGRAISIEAEIYLRALDHLLHTGGGPPARPVPPMPPTIAAGLRAVLSGAPAPAQPSTPSSGRPIVPALIVVALVAAGIAVLAARRRASPAASPAGSPAGSRADVGDLLEVSRRLTSVAARGDIDRAVVREVLGLVRARGGAIVRRDGDELRIGHESHPGILVTNRLDHGSIRRVAEAGQPLVQVSATEPAIRNLPAALAAVPLVGGGRVEAVLLLIRSDTEPFTAAERDVLMALAPVAAAALDTARHARAAIEDSLIDALTGVGNRRRFDAELPAAVKEGRPAALLIADLDHFKSVNDTHGHPAGDALLRDAAALLRDTVRPGDSVYRYGGEEFCVLLRETGAQEAVEVAERARAAVARTAFDVGGTDPLRATASFGVAVSTDGDPAGLVSRADAALYEAKQAGRNTVRSR